MFLFHQEWTLNSLMRFNCNKLILTFRLQGALNLQDGFLEGDRKVNAHFGHAIASAGDLNADGYNGKYVNYY